VLSGGGSRPWRGTSSRVFRSKVWPKAAEFWNDVLMKCFGRIRKQILGPKNQAHAHGKQESGKMLVFTVYLNSACQINA
jgi:hypothetical protein